MYVKEKELREQLELRLNEMAFADLSEQTRGTREQLVRGESGRDGWSWNEQLEVGGVDITEESRSTEADLECKRLNEIIARIEKELRITQQSLSDTSEYPESFKGIRENSESEYSREKIRNKFSYEEIELTADVTDAEELAVSLRNGQENQLRRAPICDQKDARTLSLDEENNHWKRIETSLRRLLESIEKRLYASEDDGFKPEVTNDELETAVANLQMHPVDTAANEDKVNASTRDPLREERIEEKDGTDDSSMTVEKLRVELAELKREKVELAEKLVQADVNRAVEVQKLKEGHENELFSLREEKNRIENNHHELAEQFSKLEKEYATMETDIIKLQEKLLAHEMKAERVTETNEENDCKRTLMRMEEELTLAQHRNETLSMEIEMLNERNYEKDNKLEELNDRVEVANDALKEARTDLEVMKKQNGLLKDAECVLMETTDRYERRIKEVEAENEELITEVKELEMKLSTAVVSEGEHCALIEQLRLRLNDAEEELMIAREKLEKRPTLVDVGVQSTGDDSDERQETLSSYEKISTGGALAHTSDSAMVEVSLSADDEIHALREKLHKLEEVQRYSQSILDQNEQLNFKVGRLEEEVKKLSTERKQLVKRIKIMKTELDAYREEESAGRSRAGSSLILASSEATQPSRISLKQPADETILFSSGSEFEMRKEHASLTPSSTALQQRSKIVGRFLVEENDMNLDEIIRQLQMTSEERVRRRKSGFEGKQ
uniref:Pericentrin/AKAP-450 centrosomal targeting domain-containing protein n=1 Tax=Parascaris univalens TaxID=6257 RepID=A0A915ARZ0_PARUN